MSARWGNDQRSWDFANASSNRRKGDFATAIREGWQVLPPDFMAILGRHQGHRALHLMCNDGREAAFLALQLNLHVTGVDFSEQAIGFARTLNGQLGLGNEFHLADYEAWLSRSGPGFDLVLFTLGSLWWIDDLFLTFRKIRDKIVPGGRFVIFDFHPLTHCLEEDLSLAFDYPFVRRKSRHHTGILDYTWDASSFEMPRQTMASTPSQPNPFPVTDYKWSLQDILAAGIAAGGHLDSLMEFPFLWGEGYFEALIRARPMEYVASDGHPEIPLSIAIAFTFG